MYGAIGQDTEAQLGQIVDSFHEENLGAPRRLVKGAAATQLFLRRNECSGPGPVPLDQLTNIVILNGNFRAYELADFAEIIIQGLGIMRARLEGRYDGIAHGF